MKLGRTFWVKNNRLVPTPCLISSACLSEGINIHNDFSWESDGVRYPERSGSFGNRIEKPLRLGFTSSDCMVCSLIYADWLPWKLESIGWCSVRGQELLRYIGFSGPFWHLLKCTLATLSHISRLPYGLTSALVPLHFEGQCCCGLSFSLPALKMWKSLGLQ